MEGWIKLHRKILKSPMYRQLNSKQRDVMMTILLLANHESNSWEFRGDVYEVKPGQFVTSLDSLKEYCASDVSTQNIRTALLKLEKHGFLTNESTKKNRLITVLNWGSYQNIKMLVNKEGNSQPTNSQQTANRQLTTNKNEENDKNEEEVIEDDDNAYGRVMDFYQRNIGTMAPSQYEYVEDWLKTFNADVLIYAIRRAIDQGVPKWAYVNKTLVAWHEKGAKTLKDCEAQVVQFEREKEERIKRQGASNGKREREVPQLELYTPKDEEANFLNDIYKRRSETGDSE